MTASLPDARHLFAGKGDQADLLRVAEKLGLGERIHFLGFRRDVEDLFAASDFSVVASVAGEGVSGVLRESMACGVPVITTDVGGNAELVRNEETGLVVPPGRPELLCAAMIRFVKDEELRLRIAHEGRKDVVENHSAGTRGRRIIALYEEIFREKGLAF